MPAGSVALLSRNRQKFSFLPLNFIIQIITLFFSIFGEAELAACCWCWFDAHCTYNIHVHCA